ncbi:hypothetical protein M3661_17015 [Paenibacillus sp. MER 180]|uniref:hypothetical protein n=1 Tax=Paenibacillus sp. MER 180 TaxID=2939570 RepID=UPI00203D7896|nr:hypothetical protein [Paenibacillus sp. MER 180]MCM3291833.1 hypothetical protein [Paenibacillus sp. MER 180]
MHHVRKAVESRLNKLRSDEAAIKANINHLLNELKEEDRRISLLVEEKKQLESFLNDGSRVDVIK